MAENNNMREINIREVLAQMWSHKRVFLIVLPITFVLACAYILCIPRYYKAEVRMAPETEAASGLGSLSSLASSFGFDLGAAQGADAISPDLYPDLFQSNDFVVGLLDIQVRTIDGEINTDYYTYMKKHRKREPWAPIKGWITNLFKSKPKTAGTGEGGIDPFLLSEDDNNLMELIKSNITCSIDKKTDVIVIEVKDQDPLISATLADSARVHLQQFITDYRTSKARVDVEYYEQLCAQAEEDYNASVTRYGVYADSHQNMILQSYLSKRDELENDMQVKFNTLTALRQQLQTSRAKVQERTPAFTVLQNSTVPVKPAGPKRMFFVAGMLLLSFVGTSLWVCRKQLFRSILTQPSPAE